MDFRRLENRNQRLAARVAAETNARPMAYQVGGGSMLFTHAAAWIIFILQWLMNVLLSDVGTTHLAVQGHHI